jgi:hypothetical protein
VTAVVTRLEKLNGDFDLPEGPKISVLGQQREISDAFEGAVGGLTAYYN